MKKSQINRIEFNDIISDIVTNSVVMDMKKFYQHYDCTCFDHCLSVAFYSYLICKKLKLDYKSMARAAMLHDLFLYDWRVRQPDRKGLHAFKHPYVAYKNASSLFDINDKEKDIILKHMWPVTLKIPKYKESFIVSFVDKCFAVEESFIKVEECEKEKVIK